MDPEAALAMWRDAIADENWDDAVFVYGRALWTVKAELPGLLFSTIGT